LGQYSPQIISDGLGGGIVAWQDYRNGNYDIFARHVDASGTLGWTYGGTTVCAAANTQQYPQMVSDGAGGAIITWQDYRGSDLNIYAQHMNSAGVAQWAANGVAVCTAANAQTNPQIAADGMGGAYIVWEDLRSGTNKDLYAQHVNATGTMAWTGDGLLVCTEALNADQVNPKITADGNSGAAVVWEDMRSGSADVYAQRFSKTGQCLWGAGGVALCNGTGTQNAPVLFSGNAEGEYVAWQDARDGGLDIYAQHIIKPRP
jgi:hypothetical protein